MTDTLFLDIEDVDDRLLLVGWALNDGDTCSLDGQTAPQTVEFRARLADPETTKVTQGDHDLRYFLLHGHEVAGPWHNTMVMAWVLDENQPLDLESLTKKYTPALVKSKAITSVGNRLYFRKRWALDEYDEWPEAVKWQFAGYNIRDVDTLRSLYYRLRKELVNDGWEAYWLAEEVPYSGVLLRMESRGLPVDLDATAALATEVRGLRDDSEGRLRSMASLPQSFNLNSPDQVREYLFSNVFALKEDLPMSTDPLPGDDVFEITSVGRTLIHGHWLCRGRGLEPTPPAKKKGQATEGGKPSTEAKELLYKHGEDPWVREYCLEFKRLDKLLATYLDKFPKVAVEVGITVPGRASDESPTSTRIFGRFNQTGTVTGRLSSSDPNLQNIPARRELGKRVRALFRGRFIIGDYDALEMRLMAHFSGDPRLVKVFAEGGDPHALTATAIFGGRYGHDDPERGAAKEINYGTQYGGGARTLAMALTKAGYPTKASVAREYIETIDAFYPRLTAWKNRVIWRAKDTHYIETIGGHRRRLPVFQEGQGFKASGYGDRQAVNSVVQGSAADILRRVMLRVDREFPQLLLLAQIHDELIWQWLRRLIAEEMRALQWECEVGHGFNLRVPLVFVPHYCEGWDEK